MGDVDCCFCCSEVATSDDVELSGFSVEEPAVLEGFIGMLYARLMINTLKK